jgi:predicted nucleic acid-binding Zn ribbon protein
MTFSYLCKKCGKELEQIHPMGQAPEQVSCSTAKCDGRADRMYGASAFLSTGDVTKSDSRLPTSYGPYGMSL